MTTLGQRLRKLRRDRDWTQKEVEQRTGIHQGTITNLERDKVPNPTSNTLESLASLYSVTVDYLLHGGPTPVTEGEIDINHPPFQALLEAAGEWSEARELELRRLWPAFTARERRGELARLRRLATLRAEMSALRAEVETLQREQAPRHSETHQSGPAILKNGQAPAR